MKTATKVLKTFLFITLSLFFLLFILFGYRDKTVEELSPKYAPTPSAFVNVDGMNVHYRDEGNPNDTLPLVLLHGTSSSLHTFNAWVDVLKNQKRIVRMDLPAFGLTGPFPNHDYTIANYLNFIEHFLAAKGIKRCILAGNSLGGQIAWQFTIKKPEMVEKLILIDAAGYPLQYKRAPLAFILARKPIINNLLTFITPRFLAKSGVENVYADKTKVTEALSDRYFDLTLRAGNRRAFIERMTTVYDTLLLPRLRTIPQRTLVLWGEQDQLIPLSNAHRFHDDLPNDTLIILPNAGHVPMEEIPKESLAALLAFLNE